MTKQPNRMATDKAGVDEILAPARVSLRVKPKVKKRLKRLAKATGRQAIRMKTNRLGCSLCGNRIHLRSDGKIIDGHYFGEVPLYRKSELGKMQRSGVRKAKIGRTQVEVYKYDPKPYKHVEYWECLPCYRQQPSPLRKFPDG